MALITLFDEIDSCTAPTGTGPSLKIALDSGDVSLFIISNLDT